jgi:hypothetical protein
LGKLTHLLSITIEYENADWKTPENENDECGAEKSSCTYEIIESTKDWYDIKVKKAAYAFTKGCKESFITKETEMIYQYNGQEYVEK